jgi:hypothetical protein
LIAAHGNVVAVFQPIRVNTHPPDMRRVDSAWGLLWLPLFCLGKLGALLFLSKISMDCKRCKCEILTLLCRFSMFV